MNIKAVFSIIILMCGLAVPNMAYAGDLHAAAVSGDVALFNSLLDEGYDINETDSLLKRAPLHWAVFNNRLAIVNRLIEKKANLDSPEGVSGGTALFMAVSGEDGGYLDIVKALVAAGADPNIKQRAVSGGSAPLHAAARRGNLEILKTLIAAKNVDINIQETSVDTTGGVYKEVLDVTPLHAAAGCGRAAIVEALINAGADTTIKNKQGQTAAQLAAAMGKPDIVNLITKPAKPSKPATSTSTSTALPSNPPISTNTSTAPLSDPATSTNNPAVPLPDPAVNAPVNHTGDAPSPDSPDNKTNYWMIGGGVALAGAAAIMGAIKLYRLRSQKQPSSPDKDTQDNDDEF